jgi:hypothetical protein
MQPGQDARSEVGIEACGRPGSKRVLNAAEIGKQLPARGTSLAVLIEISLLRRAHFAPQAGCRLFRPLASLSGVPVIVRAVLH